MSKRLFVLLVLFVILIGAAGITSYAYVRVQAQLAQYRVTSYERAPRYLYSIVGLVDRPLRTPLGVAVASGNVFVTDSGNGKVSVFTASGRLVSSVKPIPEVAGVYPMGIAVDGSGRYFVSARVGSAQKVIVFSPRGRFQYFFPDELLKKAPGASPLKRPVGLLYRDEKIYVTDVGDHDVKVFDLDGRLLLRFGSPGSKTGQFLYPNGIAVDERGSMFVADSNNARVQQFDSNGKFVRLLLTPGDDSFALPRGVAIDSLGRVHVTDTFKHKVYVFSSDGRFLLSYGTGRTRDSSLSYPNGIAADPTSGYVFIADRQNDRISVWGQ